MKRYLHFYVWLAAVIMMICGITTISAQTKVTSLGQLKAGSVIKIYPKNSGWMSYGDRSKALACSDKVKTLTSYETAGSGDLWTLVDDGRGCFYLKNDLGYYWSCKSRPAFGIEGMPCTTSIGSAVSVRLTWDFAHDGVCFWNQEDGFGLNQASYKTYNWYSTTTDYTSDSNSTFEIAIVQEGKEKITRLSQLRVGSVINIYPKNSNGRSNYGDIRKALATNVGSYNTWLSSYSTAGTGFNWTLVDAGDGYCYLKNDLGKYWSSSKGSSNSSMYCTDNLSSAAKVSLTWDSKYGGVCFWNQKNGKGLNNLNGSCDKFNWYPFRKRIILLMQILLLMLL